MSNQEIERKFLIKGQFPSNAPHHLIQQGYLNRDPERTVRIRTNSVEAFITVKGKSNDSGTSRFEWEQPIRLEDAAQMMQFADGVVSKIRYYVPVGKHIFEVDVFQGENFGLVVAEIELQSEDEEFERPEWLGEEVTGDPKYYNSRLVDEPYTKWPDVTLAVALRDFGAKLMAGMQEPDYEMQRLIADNLSELYLE